MNRLGLNPGDGRASRNPTPPGSRRHSLDSEPREAATAADRRPPPSQTFMWPPPSGRRSLDAETQEAATAVDRQPPLSHTFTRPPPSSHRNLGADSGQNATAADQPPLLSHKSFTRPAFSSPRPIRDARKQRGGDGGDMGLLQQWLSSQMQESRREEQGSKEPPSHAASLQPENQMPETSAEGHALEGIQSLPSVGRSMASCSRPSRTERGSEHGYEKGFWRGGSPGRAESPSSEAARGPGGSGGERSRGEATHRKGSAASGLGSGDGSYRVVGPQGGSRVSTELPGKVGTSGLSRPSHCGRALWQGEAQVGSKFGIRCIVHLACVHRAMNGVCAPPLNSAIRFWDVSTRDLLSEITLAQ